MPIVDENWSLLRNKRVFQRSFQKRLKYIMLLSILLITAIITIYFPQITTQNPVHNHKNKRNLIFFVTDGMGPASLSLTRSYRQFTENLPINDTLVLDHHLIGSSRTRSSDSLITDSAAGATAFACALKTYNGAIGVNTFKQPCGTILESAKLNGFMTGLVVTTRITDATPAAFSSHADYRFQEDLIALHQFGEYPLGRMVDLMIGGGKTHFGPNRKDGRNLLTEASKSGWQVVENRKDFDSLMLGSNVSLPLMALLADFDIPFDIDRDENIYPSLEEQTITAIKALSEATKDSDQGFFLLIEGSRIDHAGHQNDPAAQVREVLAFDKAFQAALNFAQDSDIETVLLSTSDHETGGLVTARQVTEEYPDYVWFPEVLANSKHSGEFTQKLIVDFKGTLDEKIRFIKEEIMEKILHIKDFTQADLAEIAIQIDGNKVQNYINEMISVRAQIGWTTHGHSAVDVNIYAYANRRSTWYDLLGHLQGNHENIEIGAYMSNYLNLNLTRVTDLINTTNHTPDILELKGKQGSKPGQYDKYHHKISPNH